MRVDDVLFIERSLLYNRKPTDFTLPFRWRTEKRFEMASPLISKPQRVDSSITEVVRGQHALSQPRESQSGYCHGFPTGKFRYSGTLDSRGASPTL